MLKTYLSTLSEGRITSPVDLLLHVREEIDRPEVEIARIAESQHGVVTVAQLRAAGVEKNGVTLRLRAGRLHRLHRGVYAVGYRSLSQESRWMAAVLACGQGAVLSHTSAAALWGFLKPFRGPIHVSIPRYNGQSRRTGIALHRCASLATNPVPRATIREGIPVTTRQRTIDDLRASAAPYLVRRAIRQAEFSGPRRGHRVPDPRDALRPRV